MIKGFGLYTKYLHAEVLRAVVFKEQDARLLAEKWKCSIKTMNIPMPEANVGKG